ncbi:dna mismatch repair c-terminal domain-containing protein [Cystoisospora suis]|uniref:Dna mismatch repair c-terminal domain-containing protein n=1 Tax=Cystoisospora suis TaxID=483139 RepID=A0A2C6JVL4_9APIC|nr:dna mismatch repair c-terminal domain-containing protein [Cystoisospora suis]
MERLCVSSFSRFLSFFLSVEVRLVASGLESIEVRDNGRGISPTNFDLLGRRHATSKIEKFEDLYTGLDSMGFRGEALSSLCSLGDVCILTRTLSDVFASRLIFDRQGKIIQNEPSARELNLSPRLP